MIQEDTARVQGLAELLYLMEGCQGAIVLVSTDTGVHMGGAFNLVGKHILEKAMRKAVDSISTSEPGANMSSLELS